MDGNTKKTVSVIIPTYNRPDGVRRAIDSALTQSYDSIEVIVVDDGSRTNTHKIIDEYSNKRLRFFEHECNQNASAARNTGLDYAVGDYIALLDDDDEWASTKIERQISDLETRSDEFIASYCDIKRKRANPIVEFIDRTIKRPRGIEGDEKVIEAILTQRLDFGGNSTLLIKKEELDKINGFDESFDRYQDREMLLRLLQNGKIGFLDEELVYRYSTGRSHLETILQTQEQYFDKFDDLITKLESRRVPVYATHNFSIARKHFSCGNFTQGFKNLRRSVPPHLRDVLSLVQDFFRGLIRGYT